MELKVEEIKALEPINFNYEEIKGQLSEQLEKYDNVVYTEGTLQIAKNDKATLNKVKEAINDEKKRVKNLILKDYTNNFEPKCKEPMEMIEKVTDKIDVQVKGFEKIEKDNKTQKIMEYWIENANEFSELIDFETVFNEQWLNKTYTLKKVQADIDHILNKTKMDLSTLNTTVKDLNILKQVKDFYFNNIKSPSILSLAIAEAQRIEESNKKLDNLDLLTKNEEKLTNNSQMITNSSQNVTKNEENITKNEDLQQIDFRVWVTQEQKFEIREFLIAHNIKFGKVK